MPSDESTRPEGQNRSHGRLWLILGVLLACWLLGSCGGGCIYLSLQTAQISRWNDEETIWWRSLGDDVDRKDNRYLAFLDVCADFKTSGLPSLDWHHEKIERFPAPGDPWPADDRLFQEAIVERSVYLDRLRKAASLPGSRRLDSDVDRNHPESIFPAEFDWERMHLLNMLTYRGWSALDEGRWSEGSQDLVAAARLAVDQATGAPAAEALLAIATLRMIANAIHGVIPGSKAAPEELRRLADSLIQELDRFPTPTSILRSDRLRMLLYFETGYIPKDWDLYKSTWLYRRWRAMIGKIGARRVYERIEELMELYSLPYLEQKEITRTTFFEKLVDESLPNQAVKLHVPGLSGVRRTVGMSLGELLLATTALRAQAVRIEKGTHASSLAELSRLDGRRIPNDPFTGNPLGWRLGEDGGVLIYHVSKNGKDDGGKNYDLERSRFPRATDASVRAEIRETLRRAGIRPEADDQGIQVPPPP